MILPQFIIVIVLFAVFKVEHVTARYERVRFVSDPIQLLLQDRYLSLQNRDYVPMKRPWRQDEERRYTSFPSSFYNTLVFGENPLNRRNVIPPYTDLVYTGR